MIEPPIRLTTKLGYKAYLYGCGCILLGGRGTPKDPAHQVLPCELHRKVLNPQVDFVVP